MVRYIWLNPVVRNAYPEQELEHFLLKNNFVSVFPKIDHLSQVKKEYAELLKNSDRPIIDQRCPLMHEYFRHTDGVVSHEIEPILMHVAREMATREDLMDAEKWIITPCASLCEVGEKAQLKNMVFMTWDDFVQGFLLNIQGRPLAKSPIPFGFFKDISERVISLSCDNLTDQIPNGTQIVEGLYCHGGCHFGDGVKCIGKK